MGKWMTLLLCILPCDKVMHPSKIPDVPCYNSVTDTVVGYNSR